MPCRAAVLGGLARSVLFTHFAAVHSQTTPDVVSMATDGTAVRGIISVPNHEMLFEFTAEAGHTYQLDTEAGSLEDTVMELRDTDGTTTLAENDDDTRATGRLDSYIEWSCDQSGTYYVAVDGYGESTGTFTLSITDDAANCA